MSEAKDYIALQVVMMPSDANPLPTTMLHGNTPFAGYSTIFGGVILSYIDMAGSIAARREAALLGRHGLAFVTVAINRVEFKQPVLVGDVVKFVTRVARLGRTSITMHIDVIAERGADTIPVTEAEVVYVAVDPAVPTADRTPVAIKPGG